MKSDVLSEANYLLGDELNEGVAQMIANGILNFSGFGFLGTLMSILFGMSYLGLKQIKEFRTKLKSEDPLVRVRAKIADYFSHHPMKMTTLAHDYLGHSEEEKYELIRKIENDVGLDDEEVKAFEKEIKRLSKMLHDVKPMIDDSGLHGRNIATK